MNVSESSITETAEDKLTLDPEKWCLRAMAFADVEPGVMPIESVSFGPNFWSADAFRNEISNQMGHYFVLEQTQTSEKPSIVGYCGGWTILDECHVTTVAISPDWRGYGLGHLLILHYLRLAYAKGARWVTLEVRASNLAAQNLYYKYKFHVEGVRHKYYQDTQEDAIIMTTEDLKSSAMRQLLHAKETWLQARWQGQLIKGFGLPT